VNPEDAIEATVFVVDDDVSVRESLEVLIRLEGWSPALFSSASAFLGPGNSRNSFARTFARRSDPCAN